MLKKLPDKMGTGLHGSIPPSRYFARSSGDGRSAHSNL